jgi:plastocyanin
MKGMPMSRNVLFPLLLGVGSIVAGSNCRGDNITINIQTVQGLPGNHAQYIQQGQNKQFNVVVTVGDTVTWVNPAGNSNHTATSELRDSTPAHARIFDVAVNAGQSQSFPFPQAVYDDAVAAGGDVDTNTGNIQLGYYCKVHPTVMGGRIVLAPANRNAAAKKHK